MSIESIEYKHISEFNRVKILIANLMVIKILSTVKYGGRLFFGCTISFFDIHMLIFHTNWKKSKKFSDHTHIKGNLF